MGPNAYIVHSTRERLRLRIPERRNNDAYFEAVRAELDALPEGLDVRVRPSTASVLLVHPTLPLPEVKLRLGESDLFTLAQGPCPSRRALAPLINAAAKIDRSLIKGTVGSADLRTLLFLVIVALAIRQFKRGEVLGPAIPLLWTALQIAERIAAPAAHKAENASESADSDG